MPAICESIASAISENVNQGFKKSDVSFESQLAPTAKQVLTTKIEYEQVPVFSNSITAQLQSKYIVLKPNQVALSSSNGESRPRIC